MKWFVRHGCVCVCVCVCLVIVLSVCLRVLNNVHTVMAARQMTKCQLLCICVCVCVESSSMSLDGLVISMTFLWEYVCQSGSSFFLPLTPSDLQSPVVHHSSLVPLLPFSSPSFPPSLSFLAMCLLSQVSGSEFYFLISVKTFSLSPTFSLRLFPAWTRLHLPLIRQDMDHLSDAMFQRSRQPIRIAYTDQPSHHLCPLNQAIRLFCGMHFLRQQFQVIAVNAPFLVR